MMMRASLFVVVVLSHERVSVSSEERERESREREELFLHFWEEKREAEPHTREREDETIPTINTYVWKALFYFFGRGASFPTRTRRIKKRVFVSLSLLFVLF